MQRQHAVRTLAVLCGVAYKSPHVRTAVLYLALGQTPAALAHGEDAEVHRLVGRTEDMYSISRHVPAVQYLTRIT